MNKLNVLADACNNGASNISGLLISLGDAIREHQGERLAGSPALKCIIGQISFLIGESLGPSPEALRAYEDSKVRIPLH